MAWGSVIFNAAGIAYTASKLIQASPHMTEMEPHP
jgi:hypothetical protein